MRKLGILGLGHMGMAIAKGAAVSIGKDAVAGYDPSPEKRTAGEMLGIEIADSVSRLCESAHIVLVAVRPQDIEGLLNELKASHPQCLLTIAAGIPIRRYTDALGPLPVIRAMPNTPLQLGEGAVALCRNELCSEEDFRFAIELFRSMGTACEISEDHMCDIIAVNGSTPAYFYYLIECLLEDAVSRGISREDARELLVQTMIGSGKMLMEQKEKPISVFVDEVCSKGGTTIEAINVLKEADFRKLIRDADEACIRRAEELGKQY